MSQKCNTTTPQLSTINYAKTTAVKNHVPVKNVTYCSSVSTGIELFINNHNILANILVGHRTSFTSIQLPNTKTMSHVTWQLVVGQYCQLSKTARFYDLVLLRSHFFQCRSISIRSLKKIVISIGFNLHTGPVGQLIKFLSYVRYQLNTKLLFIEEPRCSQSIHPIIPYIEVSSIIHIQHNDQSALFSKVLCSE